MPVITNPYRFAGATEFDSMYESFNPLTTVNKQHFVEWFSGSSLPSYWNLWTLGSPVTQMSDSVDGGYEIYVDTTNYQASISFDDLGRQYSHNSSVFICVSENSESVGTQGQGLISLESDTQCVSNDGYIFQVSGGVYFITSDGTRGVTNTGLTPDANPHVYKGEAKASSCEGSVDGVLKATNTTNLPAIKLQPMFWKKMGSTSGTAKIRYFEAYNT